VRWGQVYRADTLHLLTDADVEVFERIGLRAVYDLRRPHERIRHPTRLPARHGHRDIHLDVFDDPAATPGRDLLDQLVTREWVYRTDEQMIERYIQMAQIGAPSFGRLLTALAAPDGLPALFHCAAGKDRTGVAAALILRVLGVERGVVVEDYAATNTYRTSRYIERVRTDYEAAGVDVEQIRPIIDARPAVIAGTLDWIDETFGSVEEYLVRAAGVERPALDALRRALVVA